MKNRKLLLSGICILMVILLFSVNAFANSAIDTDKNTSLNILFSYEGENIEGVKCDLYKVAEIDAYGNFVISDVFLKYGVSLEQETSEQWRALAETLSQYIQRDSIPCIDQKITDSSGKVSFKGLSVGLYLVYGHKYTEGDFSYTPEAILISLPNLDENGDWVYDVSIKCKGEGLILQEEPSKIKALKVWDDEGHEFARPDSIEVQLLCDGKVYDTVALDSGNNWRYTWDDLNSKNKWSIIEKTVPDDYTVLVSREGTTYVLTNTYTASFTSVEVEKKWDDEGYEKERPSEIEVELLHDGNVYDVVVLNGDNNWQHIWEELEEDVDWTVVEKSSPDGYTSSVVQEGNKFTITNAYMPTTPKKPRLPQTGQLWWPVPILCCAGLVFYIFGYLLRKKRRTDDKS